MTTKISEANIQDATLAVLLNVGATAVPKITNIQVTNSSYTVLDDTAIDIAGGYVKITGTGFASGCVVMINNVLATSTTFVSSTEVRAQLPATAAGTYIVYLVNSDGGTAIRVNGVTFSSTPTWVSSSTMTTVVNTAISTQLSATGATSYEVAAGSTLPPGLTLSSSGLLSGSVNAENPITYNFTINAIDAEKQDSPRTISLTVTFNVIGQIAYTTPGTYSWTAPARVTSVSVVCVGGGGAGNTGWWGGGGGGLGWKNNIAVTPGQSYTVVVGAPGNNVAPPTGGGSSYFINASTVAGLGGGGGTAAGIAGGGWVGDGGGNGGASGTYGGGGAGGYSGNGGNGAGSNASATTAGSGGGGGGGANRGGGGVGILGQGTSGAIRTTAPAGGAGGSGGAQGGDASGSSGGGAYGGGGGGSNSGTAVNTQGASGAVRIIWGMGRAFPATLTTDQTQ